MCKDLGLAHLHQGRASLLTAQMLCSADKPRLCAERSSCTTKRYASRHTPGTIAIRLQRRLQSTQ